MVSHFLLRHRVVAAAAPGMAAQQAADGEVKPFQRTVFLDGLDGVLRTGGSETTGRGKKGGDEALVEADGENEQGFHGLAAECSADVVRVFFSTRSAMCNRMVSIRPATRAVGTGFSDSQMKAT